LARLLAVLLRRVMDFLRDVPPESARLQEATEDLVKEIHRAREYCGQMAASAARARLELGRLEEERDRLMEAAADQQRQGDEARVQQMAAEILDLKRRVEAQADTYRAREQRFQAAQAVCRTIEEEANKRLAEAREIAHLEAINRIRAAMLENMAQLDRTRAQVEYDDAAQRIHAEAAKGEAGAALTGEEMAVFKQKLREQLDEEDLNAVMEAIRQRASSGENRIG
jgi:hypothetical protein